MSLRHGLSAWDAAGALRRDAMPAAGDHTHMQMAERISPLIDRCRAWLAPRKQALKKIALGVALVLFTGGLVLSLRATPDIMDRIRLAPFVIMTAALLPAGVAMSAADFQILARLSGVRVKFRQALEITLYSRAANMLPIPGSMAVRMAVLKASGATFVRSGGLMALFTGIWGGAGFCFSALWLFGQAPALYAWIFAAVGAAILAGCWIAVRWSRLDLHLVSLSAALRVAMIVLEALVLMMAVQAVGVDAHYHQTAILVVASFIASVVPAGLGVRETLMAALAPIAGIDPATGFLAGAAARLAGMASLALLSVIAIAARREFANAGG